MQCYKNRCKQMSRRWSQRRFIQYGKNCIFETANLLCRPAARQHLTTCGNSQHLHTAAARFIYKFLQIIALSKCVHRCVA